MTRINAAIEPCELPNKLLGAELYEIRRLPTLIRKGRYSLKGIPTKFKLGTGHVKFFYDKGRYTFLRYKALYFEALDRGFNVTDFSGAWKDYPMELYNDWEETEQARELLIQRINERGFKLLTTKTKNNENQQKESNTA